MACQTQWRWIARPDGQMRATGLDYNACESGLRMAGIEVQPEVWEQVQVIEQAARAELNGPN